MDTKHTLLIVILYFILGIQDSMQQLIRDIACERDTLNINCGPSQVIKIHSAGYGREGGTSICLPETRDCPWAPNSLGKVKQRCQAKETCKVEADNSVFGDPCVGIVKYLQVDYSCEYRTCEDFRSECSSSEGRVCQDFSDGFRCVCMDGYELREGICIMATPTESSTRTPTLFTTSTPPKSSTAPSTESIQALYQTDITSANAESVAAGLTSALAMTNTSNAEELMFAIDVFQRIVEEDVFSDKVTTSLVVATNEFSMFEEDAIDQVPEVGQIPLLLEHYLVESHESGLNFSSTLENIGVLVTTVSPSSYQDGVTFGSVYAGSNSAYSLSNLSENYTGLLESGAEMFDNVTSTISIPASVLTRIDQDEQANEIPLTFLVYKDDTLFPLGKTNDETTKEFIDSQVISAAVGQKDVAMNNLTQDESVTIRFRPSVEYESGLFTERHCVYWRYNEFTNLTEWATYGCKEVTGPNDIHVVCTCNHLTSFAVLVRIHADGDYLSHRAFDVISKIGCIVSIVGLAFCVIISLTIKVIREKQLTQIHINLSVSLVVLYTTFLVGIDATSSSAVCQFVTALIHFSCLSSMTWMSVEAVNMFLLLWLRRRSGMKSLIPIGMVVAWGVPLVISVLTYFLSSSNADVPQDYCFLHPGFGLYFAFLLPMFLMFLLNATVFLLISYRVAFRKIFMSSAEARKKAELARIKGPILFWILLGMSWFFGFAAAVAQGSLRVVLECMFSVFLGLQGILMFYVITVNNPDVCEKISKIKASVVRLSAKEPNSDAVFTGTSTTKLKNISTISKDDTVNQTTDIQNHYSKSMYI